MLSGKVQALAHKISPLKWRDTVHQSGQNKKKQNSKPKLTSKKVSTNIVTIFKSHLVGTQQSVQAAFILSDLVATPAPLRLVRALKQPLSVLKSRPQATNPTVCAAFCCRLDRRPIRDWEFSVSVTARDCSCNGPVCALGKVTDHHGRVTARSARSGRREFWFLWVWILGLEGQLAQQCGTLTELAAAVSVTSLPCTTVPACRPSAANRFFFFHYNIIKSRS